MTPSERYAKLCDAAAEASREFLARRSRRKQTAQAVSVLLVEYLCIPEGNANLVPLRADLSTDREKRCPLGSDITLQPGNDGLWYFGLDLKFEKQGASHYGEVILRLGVDATEDGFVLKLLEEGAYKLPELNREALETFMWTLYQDLLDTFSSSPRKARGGIGFVKGE